MYAPGRANPAAAAAVASNECRSLHVLPILGILQATNEMDGSESDLLPTWVKEAVLKSSYTTPPELKCAFILLPKEVCLDFHVDLHWQIPLPTNR